MNGAPSNTKTNTTKIRNNETKPSKTQKHKKSKKENERVGVIMSNYGCEHGRRRTDQKLNG